MIYLRLFYEFFKIGLFAIGGGMATIPFLTELGTRTGWFTTAQLADMIAVSESTPGPIGVNMATYVGFTFCGVPGAVVSTLGLIAPSFIIIMIVAKFLDRFRTSKLVDNAFYGVRPASSALITSALLGMIAICLFGAPSVLAMAKGFTLSLKYIVLFAALLIITNIKPLKKLHPLVFIAASAVIGIIFKFAEV